MAEISVRAENIASTFRQGDKYQTRVNANKYNDKHNPSGIIDLGEANNKLCEDLILEKLKSCDVLDGELLHYPTAYGTQSLRETVVAFLKRFVPAKAELSAENVIVTTGLATGLEHLVYSVADKGDAILVPSPFWDKFPRIFADRCQVDLEEVPLSQEDGYRLTKENLEKCHSKAISKGKKVKGLLLINPVNPLGTVYSKQELVDALLFAKRHKLHVIVDEVYALSIHDQAGYCSTLMLEELPDPERTHVAWAVSKDLGLSGYRCGFLISWNKRMVQCLRSFSFYNMVPALIQAQVCWLLQQIDWFQNKFLPTFQERLRNVCVSCTKHLEAVGATVLQPQGGLYLWVNFSKFLSEPTFEGERQLVKRFLQAGVYFRPGQIFHSSQPGYFRIVFTNRPEILEEGLKRMEQALQLKTSTLATAASAPADLGDLLDLDDFQIVDVGTTKKEKAGGSENIEDLVKSLKKSINASDWLNPQIPEREAQERVWTILEPPGENQGGENPGKVTEEEDQSSQGATGGVVSKEDDNSLEDLMRTLKQNIKASDWLKSEDGRWEAENPDAAVEYRKAMTEDAENVDCKTQ